LKKKTLYEKSKFYIDAAHILNDIFKDDHGCQNYKFLLDISRKYMTFLPFFAPINRPEDVNCFETVSTGTSVKMNDVYDILKKQRRSNALIEAWHRVIKSELSAKALEIGKPPVKIGRFVRYIVKKFDSKVMSCKYDLPESCNSRN
jgi:hypothetical protein